jgi:hypothetical protein
VAVGWQSRGGKPVPTAWSRRHRDLDKGRSSGLVAGRGLHASGDAKLSYSGTNCTMWVRPTYTLDAKQSCSRGEW